MFLRVLRSLGEFRGQSSPATWLYSVTTHYCLNRLRDRRRRRALWNENLADSTSFQPDRVTTDPTALLLMRRRVRETPDERWAQAAIYVYLDGMSHDEAADVLQVSKRTVGNFLERFCKWAAHMDRGPAAVTSG